MTCSLIIPGAECLQTGPQHPQYCFTSALFREHTAPCRVQFCEIKVLAEKALSLLQLPWGNYQKGYVDNQFSHDLFCTAISLKLANLITDFFWTDFLGKGE